jgi:hypothetical protein
MANFAALSLLLAGPCLCLVIGQTIALGHRCVRCMRDGDDFKTALSKADRWE